MNRIFCIVGKSASGKDTIYKEILEVREQNLIPVVPYTTRPMRVGEENGVDYNFVTETEMRRLEREGRIIERRQYNTTQGIWYYFTVKFDTEEDKDYILISTLEGAHEITRFYGTDRVKVIYLALDDETRLLRCIARESKQKKPDYSEVCRRFLADQEDFSEDKINAFENLYTIDTKFDVECCLKQWNDFYISL